jgi:hypothetical protein
MTLRDEQLLAMRTCKLGFRPGHPATRCATAVSAVPMCVQRLSNVRRDENPCPKVIHASRVVPIRRFHAADTQCHGLRRPGTRASWESDRGTRPRGVPRHAVCHGCVSRANVCATTQQRSAGREPVPEGDPAHGSSQLDRFHAADAQRHGRDARGTPAS